MADSESDRIAKMLHAMSSGEQTEDESPKQEHHDDNIFATPPQDQPAAPATPKPAAPRPATAKPATAGVKPVVVPRVVVRPAPAPIAAPTPAPQAPRPVAAARQSVPAAPQPVQAGSSVAPRPTAPALPKARPLATPRPGAPSPVPPQPAGRPVSPRPAPAPAQPREAVTDEETPPQETYAEAAPGESAEAAEQQVGAEEDAVAEAEAYADDQMEMPAVPVSSLAQHKKKPVYKRKHMVQTLGFKQAMIPISFTLFVVCVVYVAIGILVDVNSPLAALRSPIVAGAFGLVGLAMLATCIVTVGQVRHELAGKPAEQPHADQPS